MRRFGWFAVLFTWVACGGRASVPNETSGAGSAGAEASASAANIAGSGASAGAPGTGPIDTSGLSTTFPDLQCDGPLSSLHLQLPCKVGMSLGGAEEFCVVECYDVDGRTALSFPILLTQAAGSIGREMAIPFAGLPGTPSVAIEVDGRPYTGSLSGSLTFEQVDLAGRAFVADLTRAHISWTSSIPETDCELDTMRLWATAGDFR